MVFINLLTNSSTQGTLIFNILSFIELMSLMCTNNKAHCRDKYKITVILIDC